MEKAALYLFLVSIQLFLPLSSLLAYSQSPVPPPQLRCHEEDRSALLQFKASTRPNDPKILCLDSWEELEGGARNCCSWPGVTCGGPQSRVIGLSLPYCGLSGSLNSSSGIFRLVHLQVLELDVNDFYGPISPAISNLSRSLRELSLTECSFNGTVPPSLSNFTQLSSLALSVNSFHGPILPLILNLTRLEDVELDDNQFTGEIPPSITNLIKLTSLSIDVNQFTGEIPYHIGSLTHLQELDLSFNRLHGQIPASVSQLWNITALRLGPNNLSGVVQFDMFSGMGHLKELILSHNNFSLAFGSSDADSIQNVQTLGLAGCNLTEFPEFLEKLGNLAELDLSSNHLSGQVPDWFLSVRLQTLSYLNLSGNSLTGFPMELSFYNSTQLETLDLRFNKLQGSLPITSRPPMNYLVSNNMLSGEIPQQICDWGTYSGLSFLDIAKNNFTGELPQCLSTMGLKVLTLNDNNFHGRIPLLGADGPNIANDGLKMIDLSNNRLQGPLPRSLSNASNLEFLNVGNNRIDDTFPSWLGSLSNLKVLILRSNYFHGGMEEPKGESPFPKLQIIDISHNNFQGSLPSSYFQFWRSIGGSSPERGSYFGAYIYSSWVVAQDYPYYDYSMTINNKGVEMEYGKIIKIFRGVDLSSNNFTGKIPDSIASLDGLQLLNLSNNLLTGSVPPSLGALAQLETLDLSGNELSGEIPRQLTQLKYLAAFNVSYNNLSGPIPQGKQFNTFPNNSYWGNLALCGDPLSIKCGNPGQLPRTSPESEEKDEGSDVLFEIEWKAVVLGYASSFVIAAVIGHKIISKWPNWFARTFRLRQLARRRR